ncbi:MULTISPECIES: subclass B3 metallo-beta-lactamase [Niastella]|uniref:Subclass B3 metallo-beta-lactamase n=1 Tax=Niastella soli TaxID=2821487 RepID=A0ABS3Z2L3_9BACT|nr:subclass B3 metallo-beta-lactamase [Niastella soli]MBO9204398.1 subclass B3 metallo-beta-lactamase [Niastella soli]
MFRKIVIPVLVLFAVHANVHAQKLAPLPMNSEEWSKPTEPFRIAGNLYYVGTYDLGCYLIATPKGHILINTGLAESVPMIKKNMEQLGFKFSDIKILLTTQAHFDHVAGMAEIKKGTHAKMMVDAKDAKVLADGGNSDYYMGGKGPIYVPVKADKLLNDQDSISLGGTTLVLLHHPGHTQGSCSFLVTVKDEKRSYAVLIANMPTILPDTKMSGMPGYDDISKDFAYTLDAMKKLQFDLWVASHASQFDMHEKRKDGAAYNPEAFADRAAYDKIIEAREADYKKALGK